MLADFSWCHVGVLLSIPFDLWLLTKERLESRRLWVFLPAVLL